MTTDTLKRPSAAQDEAEIRRLIKNWSRALEARDLAGLTADYAPDALLFDAIPGYKVEGAENIRKIWEQCLPCLPETFRSEHRDLVIHVDGDLALVHGLHHFVPTPADHPCGSSWMRITVGYRRVDAQWKVFHEHVSVPFNPMNGKAWYITNPDVVDMPDYSDASGECGPKETPA